MHADADSMSQPVLPREVARKALRALATEGVYEFRRYHYTDGWDNDDAALGWIDEDIARRPARMH